MSRLPSQIGRTPRARSTEAPKESSQVAAADVQATSELVADLPAGLGLPAGLPRSRGDAPPKAWNGPGATAVNAVLLGAVGVGAVLGAPASAEAAETLATDDVHAATTRLDAARRTLSDAEIATAREDAWTAFVASGGAAATTTEAVLAPIDAAALLPLSDSVGVGGDNNSSDVRRVQQRLKDKGFVIGVDGIAGGQTERLIRVFESMVTGVEDIKDCTGRIEPGSALHRALASDTTPQWEKVPKSGAGFVNGDTDGYSYASSRLVDTIKRAGERYEAGYRGTNPTATPITTNDGSRRAGGPSTSHESHQAGLDLDLRLPRKDGTAGSRTWWANYDREAAYAMLVSFAKDANVDRVLIGDKVLLTRIAASDAPWKDKVVDGGRKHRDHMHVDISAAPIPPALSGGG